MEFLRFVKSKSQILELKHVVLPSFFKILTRDIFQQVNESSATTGSPGEQLSRRCVTLLKSALKNDIWPNCELKLTWYVSVTVYYGVL